MKTFEGWGNNVSVSVGEVFSLGLNVGWVENRDYPGEYLLV